jgi:hypothetical protein
MHIFIMKIGSSYEYERQISAINGSGKCACVGIAVEFWCISVAKIFLLKFQSLLG